MAEALVVMSVISLLGVAEEGAAMAGEAVVAEEAVVTMPVVKGVRKILKIDITSPQNIRN